MKILVAGAGKSPGIILTASSQLLSCLIIVVFLLSGCSSSSANIESAALENKSANVVSVSPTPLKKSIYAAEEHIANEWKEKYDATAAELERNQRLWQESKIINYDFVIAKYAGGVTNEWNRLPVLIKIREGVKISIEKFEKDKDYVTHSRTDGFEDFDTIDKLFDFLRQELEDGKIIEAEYDKKYGYPKSASIIFSFLHSHGQVRTEISKLEIVK